MTPPSPSFRARSARLLRPTPAWAEGAGGAVFGPLLVYAALATVALVASAAGDRSVVHVEPWFPLAPGGIASHLTSLALGIALATGTTSATRAFVRRWAWARALHVDLRPAVRRASDGVVLVLGIASAASEELFFRGLLAPIVGLFLSSLAFGLLHQTRGPVRWVWASWAAFMGLLFGALFLGTGSLLGPIVAHAAINVTNLRFLRDTDVEPPSARSLGGLLRR